MPWIPGGKNQILEAQSMLQLFSLIKRVLGGGGGPKGGQGGLLVGQGAQILFLRAYKRKKRMPPPLENWSDPRLVKMAYLSIFSILTHT